MLCNKEYVSLDEIKVSGHIVEYYFSVSPGLVKYFNNNKMFIKYDDEVNLDQIPKSILAIPFVSANLPIMWLTNSVMWVKEIDKNFYRSLTRIKNAYQEIYENYTLKGSLIPAKIVDNFCKEKREALVLFSGGIDAQTTYIRHRNENPILLNIQGWYSNDDSEKLTYADKDIEMITEFCDREKVDYTIARSNFATLVDEKMFHHNLGKKLGDSFWHGLQHSMAFISIAMPICFYFGIKKIYIASSFDLKDIGRCASYPTTDSEFECANMVSVIHDGFELTRRDKVHLIVDYQKKLNRPYVHSMKIIV